MCLELDETLLEVLRVFPPAPGSSCIVSEEQRCAFLPLLWREVTYMGGIV